MMKGVANVETKRNMKQTIGGKAKLKMNMTMDVNAKNRIIFFISLVTVECIYQRVIGSLGQAAFLICENVIILFPFP
jgi:hypothetical protein